MTDYVKPSDRDLVQYFKNVEAEREEMRSFKRARVDNDDNEEEEDNG